MCDALAGLDEGKILAIMKNSRMGAYGVTGLISIFSRKNSVLLKELPFTPALDEASPPTYLLQLPSLLIPVTAHAVSRLMGVLTFSLFEYVIDPEPAAKSKPVTSNKPSAVTILMDTLRYCHWFS